MLRTGAHTGVSLRLLPLALCIGELEDHDEDEIDRYYRGKDQEEQRALGVLLVVIEEADRDRDVEAIVDCEEDEVDPHVGLVGKDSGLPLDIPPDSDDSYQEHQYSGKDRQAIDKQGHVYELVRV